MNDRKEGLARARDLQVGWGLLLHGVCRDIVAITADGDELVFEFGDDRPVRYPSDGWLQCRIPKPEEQT